MSSELRTAPQYLFFPSSTKPRFFVSFSSPLFLASSSPPPPILFACEDCVGPVAELTTTLTDYGIFVEASFLAYWTYRSYADGVAQGKTSERCSKFSVFLKISLVKPKVIQPALTVLCRAIHVCRVCCPCSAICREFACDPRDKLSAAGVQP